MLDGDGLLFLSLGATFGVGGLNNYFYEVDSQYATADRAAYEAKDGYVGAKASAGLAHQISGSLRMFAFGQIGSYAGAANADSPLHRADLTGSVGLGFTWSIFQSEARAARR